MTSKTRKAWVAVNRNGSLSLPLSLFRTKRAATIIANCYHIGSYRVVRAELRYPVKGKGK